MGEAENGPRIHAGKKRKKTEKNKNKTKVLFSVFRFSVFRLEASPKAALPSPTFIVYHCDKSSGGKKPIRVHFGHILMSFELICIFKLI